MKLEEIKKLPGSPIFKGIHIFRNDRMYFFFDIQGYLMRIQKINDPLVTFCKKPDEFVYSLLKNETFDIIDESDFYYNQLIDNRDEHNQDMESRMTTFISNDVRY